MDLEPAGTLAEVDRYIAYWESYLTNHPALEKDEPMREEVGNAVRTLHQAVIAKQEGRQVAAGKRLKQAREM